MKILQEFYRWYRDQQWKRELRRIDRRLERNFPTLADRKKKIVKARKCHKPVRKLYAEQRADMLTLLRGR